MAQAAPLTAHDVLRLSSHVQKLHAERRGFTASATSDCGCDHCAPSPPLVSRLAVDGMDYAVIKDALRVIWALVYLSKKEPLSSSQEEALHSAIRLVENNWEESNVCFPLSRSLCQRADAHLAALKAVPETRPTGIENLLVDCNALEPAHRYRYRLEPHGRQQNADACSRVEQFVHCGPMRRPN